MTPKNLKLVFIESIMDTIPVLAETAGMSIKVKLDGPELLKALGCPTTVQMRACYINTGPAISRLNSRMCVAINDVLRGRVHDILYNIERT